MKWTLAAVALLMVGCACSPEASGAGPADRAERRQVRAAVTGAIDRLAPKQRAVVTLRLIDGYSTRETAEILGVPEGTVLSRLSRALKKLQPHLQPLMEA